MPARRCVNPKCRRLIYDTEKLKELPDRIECQHCHRINVVRLKPLTTEPEPELEPGPEEVAPESEKPAPGPEELAGEDSTAAPLTPETPMGDEVPGPVIDETARGGE